jgi:hypothetical protein
MPSFFQMGKRARAGRRVISFVSGLVMVAIALGVGWWAARATLTPVTPPSDSDTQPVTAVVTQGSVGRTLGVGVTVRQPVQVVATNTLAGMVTARSAGGTIGVGDVVFVIGNVPVRAVEGDTPVYREVVWGMRGVEVLPLSRALATLGYLQGAPNDIFGAKVAGAVRAWQKNLGIEQTGSVAYGELLAVPHLPAVIQMGNSLRVGVPATGNEPAILLSSGAPEFVLVLSADQAQTITSDVPLKVSFEDMTWDAVISSGRVDDHGFTENTLTAPRGGIVCGQDCGRLPADEQMSLRGEAIVVPAVSGPSLPVAAVRTDAQGATYVVLAGGAHRDITVLGSGQGIAVVEGVEEGDEVVVFGDGDGSA